MRHLVFFLEEPSAKAMLEGLLPRFLPGDVFPRYIVFEGKSDLEKQLERKLKGWLVPDSLFVVLRDQDAGECAVIKKRLVEKCRLANKPATLVRIACRELESWYLGDLNAVERALQVRNLGRQQATRKYQAPDRLGQPDEELIRLTNGRYQKIAGSRDIGPHLALHGNLSRSFQVFMTGLQRLLGM
jgi:hypothetical protein